MTVRTTTAAPKVTNTGPTSGSKKAGTAVSPDRMRATA